MIATAVISAATFIILEALHYYSPAFSYGVAAGFIAALLLVCFGTHPDREDTQGGER